MFSSSMRIACISITGQPSPPPPPALNMSQCGVKTGVTGRLLGEDVPSNLPQNFQGLDSSAFANFVRSTRSSVMNSQASGLDHDQPFRSDGVESIVGFIEIDESGGAGVDPTDVRHIQNPSDQGQGLQQRSLAQTVTDSDSNSSEQLDFAGHVKDLTDGESMVIDNDPINYWSGNASVATATIPIAYNGGQVITYTLNV